MNNNLLSRAESPWLRDTLCDKTLLSRKKKFIKKSLWNRWINIYFWPIMVFIIVFFIIFILSGARTYCVLCVFRMWTQPIWWKQIWRTKSDLWLMKSPSCVTSMRRYFQNFQKLNLILNILFFFIIYLACVGRRIFLLLTYMLFFYK